MGKVDIQPSNSLFISEGPVQIQRVPQAANPKVKSNSQEAIAAIINKINYLGTQPWGKVTAEDLNSPIEPPKAVTSPRELTRPDVNSNSPLGIHFDRQRKRAA